MDRAEQLTRELYFVHKSGEHSVAYAVARIIALEDLLMKVLKSHKDGYQSHETNMSNDLVERIEEILPEPITGEEETDDDIEA